MVEDEWFIRGFGVATEAEKARFLDAMARARAAIREVADISPPAAQDLLSQEGARLRSAGAPANGRPPPSPEDELGWLLVLTSYERRHPGLSAAALARTMLLEGATGLAQSEEALAKRITRGRKAASAGGGSLAFNTAMTKLIADLIAREVDPRAGDVWRRAMGGEAATLSGAESRLLLMLVENYSDWWHREFGDSRRT